MASPGLLKQFGRAAYLISSRIVAYALGGLLVNGLVLVLLASEIRAFPWAAPLIVLLFGVAFPIVYVLLGKSQGVRGAIGALVVDRASDVVQEVAQQLVQAAREDPRWRDRVADGGLEQTAHELVPDFLTRLPGVSWALRPMLRALHKRVPFGDALEATLRANDSTADTNDPPPGEAIEQAIRARFAEVSWAPLLILLTTNVVVAVTFEFWL